MLNLIKDGRVIIVLYLLVYVIVFLTVQDYASFSRATAEIFNVPAMQPEFADLQVIQGAYESLQNDIYPYVQNPYDPWQRTYNYPPIWLYLLGPHLTVNNIVVAGWILITLFFISTFYFIGRVSYRNGVIYSLAIVSPAIFLLLERGNIDIIIFILSMMSIKLYMSQANKAPLLTGIFISFISILKLYPIFSLFNFYKDKKSSLIYICTIIIIFTLYIITITSELSWISANTPRGGIRSYGCAVLPTRLLLLISQINPEIKFSHTISLIIGLSVLSILSILIFILALRQNKIIHHKDTRELFSFKLGALIFIGTFAIGNNWDYRLVFLILTIPQLLKWYKGNKINPAFLISVIASLIILMNWMMISSESTFRHLLFNELLSWYLVCSYIYLYAISLPSWITEKIKFTRK